MYEPPKKKQALPVTTRREALIEEIDRLSLCVRRGQYFYDFIKRASEPKLEEILAKLKEEIRDRDAKRWGAYSNPVLNPITSQDYLRIESNKWQYEK